MPARARTTVLVVPRGPGTQVQALRGTQGSRMKHAVHIPAGNRPVRKRHDDSHRRPPNVATRGQARRRARALRPCRSGRLSPPSSVGLQPTRVGRIGPELGEFEQTPQHFWRSAPAGPRLRAAATRTSVRTKTGASSVSGWPRPRRVRLHLDLVYSRSCHDDGGVGRGRPTKPRSATSVARPWAAKNAVS